MPTMRMRLNGLSRNWLWGGTAVVLVLAVLFIQLLGDAREPDVYWHILMGADILKTGSLEGAGLPTFGPHQDWISTQSVFEVFIYYWFNLFGWGGLVFLRAFGAVLVAGSLMAASFWLLPKRFPLGLRLWLVAFVGFFGLLFASVQERPQTFTFILLPLLGVVLIRFLYTGVLPRWWVLFAFVALWTSVHGGALLIAPLILGVWILRLLSVRFLQLPSFSGQRWFIPPVFAGIAFLATLVNPVGYRLYEQGAAITKSASVGIVEWKIPFPDFPMMYLAMPIIVALWAVAMWLLRDVLPWRLALIDFLFLMPFLIYSESANRAVPIAVLVTLPLVARRWVQAFPVVWHTPVHGVAKKAAFPVALLIVVATFGLAGYELPRAQALDDEAPRNIISGLAAVSGEQDRFVVGSYNFMGRIQLLTQAQTSLDGRSDRYSYDQLYDYISMLRGDAGWDETFSKYSVSTDFVDYSDAGMVPKLKSLGWQVACEEDTANGSFVWLTAPGFTGECGVWDGELKAHPDRVG